MESRRIDVCGRSIHYVCSRQWPAGRPVVVLVHGVGLSHRYLMPYAELLARQFPVVAPDLPGFGLSFKPRRVLTLPELADALADWMQAIGLEQAALFGNSVGCQVIVNLAARHPGLVERAVLQGPTVDPAARSLAAQMWRWRQNRLAERSSDKGPIVVRDYWECGLRRLVQTFRYAIDDRTEQQYGNVRCPTLVVRGALDPIVPQTWAEAVVEMLPQGRLIVLPGVPHTANLEAPLELTRVTQGFYEAAGPHRRRGHDTPRSERAAVGHAGLR